MIMFTNCCKLYCKSASEIRGDIYNTRLFGKINNKLEDRRVYHFISEPCSINGLYPLKNKLIYKEEYTLPQNYKIYSEKDSLYIYLYL